MPHAVPSRRRAVAALLPLLLALPLAACSDDPEPGPTAAPTAGAPGTGPVLAEIAGGSALDIGFAVAPELLDEPEYREIVDTHASLVVAENVMKWETTERVQGQWDFAGADTLAQYAREHGKKLYGHTLVWHSQLPDWVAALDAPAMQAAMEEHIRTQVEHFKGQVFAWDVVNEAIDDDGTRRAGSPFQATLGDGYIEDAFRTAHEADPDAQLCYNDYDLEAIGPKSDAVYAMVSDLVARDVPIDCVGFQGHLTGGKLGDDLQENLQRFVDLGLTVRFTEVDVRIPTPPSDADLAQQAEDFGTVVSTCLAVEGCLGVTFWGVTDRYSWVPQWFPGYGAALLWDEDYATKPAFDAVVEAVGAGRPGRG
ncbi:MAG: endo-1,4-beta-xylanase [Cellulomonas sp.]|nr:endo-1,4-beta-xylanase [Cellulomonas sp.]